MGLSFFPMWVPGAWGAWGAWVGDLIISPLCTCWSLPSPDSPVGLFSSQLHFHPSYPLQCGPFSTLSWGRSVPPAFKLFSGLFTLMLVLSRCMCEMRWVLLCHFLWKSPQCMILLIFVEIGLLTFCEDFCICVHQEYEPIIFFSHDVFICLWYHSNAGPLKWTWECFLLFYFLEELGWKGLILILPWIFGRIHLWIHPLTSWEVSDFSFLVIIYSDFLFIHNCINSRVYLFLGIHPFPLGCPICCYTIVQSFMIFCISVVSIIISLSFLMLSCLFFVLVSLAIRLSILFIFSKSQILISLVSFIVFLLSFISALIFVIASLLLTLSLVLAFLSPLVPWGMKLSGLFEIFLVSCDRHLLLWTSVLELLFLHHVNFVTLLFQFHLCQVCFDFFGALIV